MVAVKGRKSSNKNPPIFSHEYVIQNHGDIVSCVAILFIIGLMVQATSPWAYMFTALQHKLTPDTEDPSVIVKYSTGWKDACVVFFYFLITIVVHAAFQDFIFDKVVKKLHLSKAKLAKFNESKQLVLFYPLSAIWGIVLICKEDLLLNIASFWNEYPVSMSFSTKAFFIGQLAYWLHCYPELYFQRVKKEDIPPHVIRTTIGLLFTAAAYFFNFQHVAVIFLVLHYTADALMHGARITHFIIKKEKVSQLTFLVANVVYVFARIATFAVAALYFVYGLSQIESTFDYSETGNFNIPAIRFSAFGLITIFQAYLLYSFISRQRKRARENAASTVPVITKPKQKSKKKEGKKSAISEDDDLPEVDQATKKNLRSRSSTKVK